MKIREGEADWRDYTIYFDGTKETRAVEADTDHQFIIRVNHHTNAYTRFYGNVMLVNNITGVVT